MTVNDLRAKLSQLDGNMRIVVYTENEPSSALFDIDDVSLQRGTPHRLENGQAGFTFSSQRTAEWVLINVSAA
jgi:hypothetical protein